MSDGWTQANEVLAGAIRVGLRLDEHPAGKPLHLVFRYTANVVTVPAVCQRGWQAAKKRPPTLIRAETKLRELAGKDRQ
jgi:hypothetical protein